jgi:hypothetical protein
MKFILALGAGVAIGFAAASRLYERQLDETRRESSSIAAAMTRHPSSQRFAGRRLFDVAGGRGAEAIRKARASIQRRLEANVDDLSMN